MERENHMQASEVVSAKVKEATAATSQALNSEDSILFENVYQYMRELETMAGEAFQLKIKDSYQSILNKLENDRTLTGEEHELLKLLIVGSAKYYLRYENNLEDWRNEIKRISGEIEQLEAGGLDDIDSLLHMQALCRDALGVLPDIAFYYREKERISRFETATSSELDAEAKLMLAEVLKSMMQSGKA
jgi:hypothetical protein